MFKVRKREREREIVLTSSQFQVRYILCDLRKSERKKARQKATMEIDGKAVA